MSIINKVKEHISSNRGKYGAAAGAGAMYGASKIDSPLVNQAGFNILAKGQNLALDAADKIDPRATTALNDLGMHKIRQEDIDASNALYNSGVAKYINPNPIDMVNANEHSTEVYNRAMAMKANAQDALVNAKNQGQDYLDQGINYIKGLNPFTENTIPGKTMQIQIKKVLLEGHQPEVIVEAVHANHPELNKKNSGNIPARNEVAKLILANRSFKKEDPTNANYYDNNARFISQTGNLGLNTRDPLSNKYSREIEKTKRLLQVPEVSQVREDMKRNGELATGLKLLNPAKVYAAGELAQKRLINKMQTNPRLISSAKK